MKLNDLLESSKESLTVVKAPAPGNLGNFITTAQAAKLLGVEMSRIRQLIMDGKLKSYEPEPGRRDHVLKRSEVEKLRTAKKDKGGRPPKDKNQKKKKKSKK